MEKRSAIIDGLGDTRNNRPMRDMADAVGNFTGRLAMQKFSAVLRSCGVNDKARARGPEYTGF